MKVNQRRHGYFPHVFTWQGREYQVEAVEQCWTVSHRGQENQVTGYRFRVRARSIFDETCQEGVFDLFQNAQAGDWHMQRQVR